MEPMVTAALAAATVKIVSEYLNKIADGAAHEAGKAVFGKAVDLYQAVKQRFTADPVAETTLEKLADAPDSPKRQELLHAQLEKILRDDPHFARRLEGLTGIQIQPDTGAVFYNNIYGEVKNLTNINTVQGDVHIG